jgi:hypothetical protein
MIPDQIQARIERLQAIASGPRREQDALTLRNGALDPEERAE